jgi:hypothetical protein
VVYTVAVLGARTLIMPLVTTSAVLIKLVADTVTMGAGVMVNTVFSLVTVNELFTIVAVKL